VWDEGAADTGSADEGGGESGGEGGDDVVYFDTFGLTEGQPSYDGTHYGQRVNVAKAQILLNFLERMVIGRGIEEALRALQHQQGLEGSKAR
jgi:hypothetical protein